MSPTRKSDCTIRASVVDQISKKQDVCRASLKFTTLVVYKDKLHVETSRLDKFTLKYCKIATPGGGRKPSREQYIAESEFALLGILFENTNDISDWSSGVKAATVKLINIFNFSYW